MNSSLYQFCKPEYHFVKFDVNTECITLTCHNRSEIRNINVLDSIILPLSISGNSLQYNGKIICKKITTVSIWNNLIFLRDYDKNQIYYGGYNMMPYPIFNSDESWHKLLNLLEKILFPHLVNNIVAEIIEKGEIEICKFYRLKVNMDGIYLGGKFIDLENVVCKINLKNWELKISNKKNIFQSRKIPTNGYNIIIMPYLIDYLKIIHNL